MYLYFSHACNNKEMSWLLVYLYFSYAYNKKKRGLVTERFVYLQEVKTRASTRFGRPIEAVTLAKQRKIHRCAEYYLQCKGLLERPPVLSFDVVEIIIEGTAAISIKHWPHCF